MKKQYLYHVTEENWGKSVILSPKSHGCNRDDSEPDTPRICTSTTIAGCLVAIYLNQLKTVNVYRTRHKVGYVKPQGVLDYKITGEKWIIKPTEFVLIANISDFLEMTLTQGLWDHFNSPDSNYFGALGDGSSDSEEWQKQTKETFQDILEIS